MAERSTFSTTGAMRLLVDRRMVIAVPAFWPRIKSTTSRAFCGVVRTYLASDLTSMASFASLSQLVVGGRLQEKLLTYDLPMLVSLFSPLWLLSPRVP